MTVRAKFTCDVFEPDADGAGGTIRMSAVTSGSAENDAFFKHTPNGQLYLSTVNQAAADQFVVGREYYLTIAPADGGDAPKAEDPPEAKEQLESGVATKAPPDDSPPPPKAA